MQDLETIIETEIAAEQSRPLLLFELYLDAGTLRYSATNIDILFPTGGGGNTYFAKAVAMGNIRSAAEGQIESASFQFDNIAGDMHTYNTAESFAGKQIIVKKIYRNVLGSATYYREIFNGIMDEPNEINKQWLVLNATNGSRFQRRVLQGYFQKECNNIFGDARCNYNGYANLTSLKATGTADSGTVSTLVDNALTQASDYWKFGKISITVSGNIYNRFVESFVASTDTITFDMPLPVAVVAGSAYTVYKGCSLILESCKGTYEYGPSANNSANYDGFIHIGDTSK